MKCGGEVLGDSLEVGVIAPVSSPVSHDLKCIPESHLPSTSSQTENVPIEVQYDWLLKKTMWFLKQMCWNLGKISPCYYRDQSKNELAVEGQCSL